MIYVSVGKFVPWPVCVEISSQPLRQLSPSAVMLPGSSSGHQAVVTGDFHCRVVPPALRHIFSHICGCLGLQVCGIFYTLLTTAKQVK